MLYLYHINSLSGIPLTKDLVIGRTEGDLVYADDKRLSGKHARLILDLEDPEVVFVQDLGSKNRTTLDRVEIAPLEKVKMKKQCFLEVGEQKFILSDLPHPNLNTVNGIVDANLNKAITKLEGMRLIHGLQEKMEEEIKEIASTEKVILESIAKKEATLAEAEARIDELVQLKVVELKRIEEETEQKIAEIKSSTSHLRSELALLQAKIPKLREEAEQKKKRFEKLSASTPTED